MNISEVFYSIQGEGIFTGTPAIFIRTAGCNLSCIWCDTPYTWRKDKFEKIEMTHREIVEKVQHELYPQNDVRLIVITGGEPLLHGKEFTELFDMLSKDYPSVMYQFETNGTIDPRSFGFAFNYNISYVVSPKFYVSMMYPSTTKPIAEFFLEKHNITWKFVVTGVESVIEINKFVEKNKIEPSKVWLMPEGVTSESQLEKLSIIIEVAKKYQFNVSTRLQILAYGNFRGT